MSELHQDGELERRNSAGQRNLSSVHRLPRCAAIGNTEDTAGTEGSTASAIADASATQNIISSASAPKQRKTTKAWSYLRWALAVAACLWLALCTAIGPLYRQFNENPRVASIAAFSAGNAILFIVAFAVYLTIVYVLTRSAQKSFHISARIRAWKHRVGVARKAYNQAKSIDTETYINQGNNNPENVSYPSSNNDYARQNGLTATNPGIAQRLRHMGHQFWVPLSGTTHAIATKLRAIPTVARTCVLHSTDRFPKLMLIFIVGWLWVPTTLVTAFGADLHSQFREFSWAWNQQMGQKEPYIGFFSFVPMDIYPTAHYMWPMHPTYLTDQHNIVLTLIYGSVASMSRYLTGANDLGIVVLSATQFLFAAFCLAACTNRFFNKFWLDESGKSRVKTLPRCLILAFLLLCPIVPFSTISLTKSPLFAFAFAWWFSINVEICKNRKTQSHTSLGTCLALALSTLVMLCSAKYALYVIALQFVALLFANVHHWKAYAIGLLLPLIVFEGGLHLAISTGAIISGDPIESHGLQLQQIARVTKLNPNGIPASARAKLAPIFNLDQMAEAYSPQDADPVKSSGIQSKKVSYRWRTVTKSDMKQFNEAWLEIVKANPVIATDALLAECYGYFDIADPPYVDMTYYVSSPQIGNASTWIVNWLPGWRKSVTDVAKFISAIPGIGWLVHGNLYVIATLLIGAAEVVQRRWHTLACHMPLLLLMGVMITSPANNFERHMLPLVFVFGFVALTFAMESSRKRGTETAADASDTQNHDGGQAHHSPNKTKTVDWKNGRG